MIEKASQLTSKYKTDKKLNEALRQFRHRLVSFSTEKIECKPVEVNNFLKDKEESLKHELLNIAAKRFRSYLAKAFIVSTAAGIVDLALIVQERIPAALPTPVDTITYNVFMGYAFIRSFQLVKTTSDEWKNIEAAVLEKRASINEGFYS